MKDLKVRQEVTKILEEKAGKNLFVPGRGNFLLSTCPEARETKAKMNYWDLIKTKSFCTAKEKPFCTAGGNENWCSHSGKQYGGSSKSLKWRYPMTQRLHY